MADAPYASTVFKGGHVILKFQVKKVKLKETKILI